MGMRARLLGSVRPRLPLESVEVGERSQRSVWAEWQDGHRARAIVRQHEEAIGRVDSQAHAILAVGGLTVQGREASGCRVDLVRRRLTTVAVRGVERALLAIEGQKRRIRQV